MVIGMNNSVCVCTVENYTLSFVGMCRVTIECLCLHVLFVCSCACVCVCFVLIVDMYTMLFVVCVTIECVCLQYASNTCPQRWRGGGLASCEVGTVAELFPSAGGRPAAVLRLLSC